VAPELVRTLPTPNPKVVSPVKNQAEPSGARAKFAAELVKAMGALVVKDTIVGEPDGRM
jgi:hypothetical protein